MLLVPAAMAVFATAVGATYLFTAVPLPDEVFASPTLVLDGSGHELGTLQPQHERTDIALDEVPQHVIDSVLAAEDARFYEHRGLSLPGLLRAAWRNVVAGEVRQGGSTISQQYVKNAVLGDRERTFDRKIREAALAVKLERNYTKDEILGFYLNTVYFGRGAYGVQAAAQAFYGVDARDLSVAQAAQLAGVIPAPSRLDPLKNPEAAQARYRYVLDRLVALGRLDPATAGRLAAQPPQPLPRDAASTKEAPAFFAMVEDELEARLGGRSIYSGLTVRTTLNIGVQRAAAAAYSAGFDPAQLQGDEAGRRPTGALVAVDPGTGGVRALVGGSSGEQINLAVDNRRQPGSIFKVFALAAWLEQGKSPESYFDAPAIYAIPDAAGGRDYEVHNYGNVDFGEMSLREASWQSVNTVYAQVWQDVGSRAFLESARDAGIDAALPDGDPSVVLGTAEVSPLEVAESYNTFAAGGVHHEPYVVEEIRREDEVLYTRPIRGERAFSTRTVTNLTDVLRGVILEGTGTRAHIGRPAAGKTGTTQDYRDAWFAGYTPNLTAVVWMGHRDDNTPMAGGYTGGSVPAAVWGDFMSRALEGVEVAEFPPPEGGLEVVRAAATPTEEPLPDCPEGQVLQGADGGDAADASGAAGDADGAGDDEPRCVDEEPTPTETPTPTAEPTEAPSEEPTEAPSEEPAREPSEEPTGGSGGDGEPQPDSGASAAPKATAEPEADTATEEVDQAQAAASG